jgi:hypothetical protein
MAEAAASPAPPPTGVSAETLPELGAVYWRKRASAETLRNRGRLWTAWTCMTVGWFLIPAPVLLMLEPLSFPVALICFVYGWIVPELYAFRGANVTRPRRRSAKRAEEVAQGLLGDLLGHAARDLQRETGLAMERGGLGVWLIAEGGAVLVVPGGRRVHCFCVNVPDGELPPSDRIAHLLLALRTDEQGFATVANHAFSGAPWRLRRRMDRRARPALDAARREASSS